MTRTKAVAPPRNAPAFKPSAGYIVVEPDWNLANTPSGAWTLMTLKEAKAERAYWQLRTPGADKVIVRVETTYTVVEAK